MNNIGTEAEIFLALHKKGSETRVKKFQRVRKVWKPPDKDCYKTNFDGALFEGGELVLELWFAIIEVKLWALSLSEKIQIPPRWLLWKCWQQEEQSSMLKNLVLVSLFLKVMRRLSLLINAL